MPYTLILLLTRAPHLTPTQFKTHFETIHLPLVKSLFGPLTPVPKRRLYVSHESTTTSSSTRSAGPAQTFTPRMLKGDPASVDFDCICELEWADEETFRKFQEMLKMEENMERVKRDHEVFLREERILMVGGVESGLPAGWE